MSDDLTPDAEGAAAAGGMDRRTFVRRAAVTGALAWAAPSITSMPAAFANSVTSDICAPTLDPFLASPTTSQELTATLGLPATPPAVNDGSILGGSREAKLQVDSGPRPATLAIGPAGSPGKLFFDVGGNTFATAELKWGNIGGENLVASGADRFLLDVTSVDTKVTFEITVSDGTNEESVSQPLESAGQINIPFNHPDFVAAGVDFTNVQVIKLVLMSSAISADAVTMELKICYRN